jgi:hypothetical protein
MRGTRIETEVELRELYACLKKSTIFLKYIYRARNKLTAKINMYFVFSTAIHCTESEVRNLLCCSRLTIRFIAVRVTLKPGIQLAGRYSSSVL